MTTPRDDSSAAADPGGGTSPSTSAGTDTDAGAGAPTDLELAWIYALNADLGPDPQDGAARQRAERSRARRYDR
jgi:hypothetical protein